MPEPAFSLSDVTRPGTALARQARMEAIVLGLLQRAISRYLATITQLVLEQRYALSPVRVQDEWNDTLAETLTSPLLSADMQAQMVELFADSPLPEQTYTSAMNVLATSAQMEWSNTDTAEVMALMLSPDTGTAIVGTAALQITESLTAAGRDERKRKAAKRRKQVTRSAQVQARSATAREAKALAERAGLEAQGIDWWSQMKADARSAVTRADSRMTLGALDFYGVPNKRWITRRDHRVRPTHHEADGQTVPLAQPFRVGSASLMFPGDPFGQYEEIVNCRCFVVGVADDEYEVTEPKTSPSWERIAARNQERAEADLADWFNSPLG